MRGRDFLDVARYLEEAEGEAFYRTRVGRAYYAAYLETRSYCVLAFNYDRTRTSREHRDVQRLISTVDREVSTSLRFLRSYRNAADYDLELSTNTIRRNVTQAERLAVMIIVRLDELATGSPPR